MESSAHASTQSHAPVALYGVMPPLVAAGGAALCVQLCSDGGGWTLASYRVDDTPPRGSSSAVGGRADSQTQQCWGAGGGRSDSSQPCRSRVGGGGAGGMRHSQVDGPLPQSQALS